MALIYCSECGHQVSDKAPTCPNCGAPINVSTPVTPVTPVAPAPVPTSAPVEDSGSSTLVILGYVFSGVSLLIFPFILGIAGLVFGIINTAKDNVGHGIVQILISAVSIIAAFYMYGY